MHPSDQADTLSQCPLEILVPPFDLMCSEYLRLTDKEVEIMIDGRFPIDGSKPWAYVHLPTNLKPKDV
ncbi:MAG TPA: hypothetical protein VFO92_00110 [Nitrososphaeraceae archaeon]|nr:hypothetical protein [Nitrososphaeraceae archaeon]